MNESAKHEAQAVALLPCPFCGGEASLGGPKFIRCTLCACTNLALQWNRRAPTDGVRRGMECAAVICDQHGSTTGKGLASWIREAANALPAQGAQESQDAKDAALRDAAQAVVDRWETPLWKDVPPTAEFIHRLRDALAATNGSAT